MSMQRAAKGLQPGKRVKKVLVKETSLPDQYRTPGTVQLPLT